MNVPDTRVRTSRLVLFGLMLLTPIIGPGWVGIIVAAVAVMTAYVGLRGTTVYGMLAVLLGVELIYGLDVGVLSLSYITAVLLLAVVGRVIAISPWTSVGGWLAGDAVRVFVTACGLFAVMTASGVAIGHVLYGYADIGARLSSLFLHQTLPWMPVVIAVMLIVLRRIDEPFRRRIIFGTS